MNGTGPLAPHARLKTELSQLDAAREHAYFHSRIKQGAFGKPAWMRELLRHHNFEVRVFRLVLVLKFLLAPARFVGRSARGRSRLDSPALEWLLGFGLRREKLT